MASVNGNQKPSANTPQSFAQWLRGWRYFVWFLAVLLVAVLFYAEENWRGRSAWARYQREMKTRGEQTAAKEFIPPLVPYDQNFATTPLLSSAFGARSLLGFKALSAGVGLAGEFHSKYWGARSKIAPPANTWAGPPAELVVWRAVLLSITNQTLVPRARLMATNSTVAEAAESVLSALADCEPAFAELQAASRRPHSRFNIAYEQPDPASILLPHLAVLKQLSQLAWLRCSANLALGREEAAFADVELMLRLAEATQTEPILVSQWVRADQFRTALQPIAQGMEVWSNAHLRALQDHLSRFDFCADSARVLQSERSFFGDGMIEYLRQRDDKLMLLSIYFGPGGSKQLDGLRWAGLLLGVIPEGWYDLEHLNYNRMFQDYLLPTIDVTHRLIRPRASAEAEARLQALLKHSAAGLLLRQKLFCGLMLPSVSDIARKTAAVQTGADMAALACALERYRRQHGCFPETLALLVPEFMAGLPHDIVNGQPLKYHRTENGLYELYSVGWDQTDDGGRPTNPAFGESQARSGESERSSGDWVWRPISR